MIHACLTKVCHLVLSSSSGSSSAWALLCYNMPSLLDGVRQLYSIQKRHPYTGNLKSETLGESKNQLFAQLGREFWGGPPQSSAGCGFARAAHLSQNFCAGKGIFLMAHAAAECIAASLSSRKDVSTDPAQPLEWIYTVIIVTTNNLSVHVLTTN